MLKKSISSRIFSLGGFTLIELLIVLGVLVFITAVSIPAYNSFSKKQTLNAEAEKMVSYLQLAQEKARSGDKGANETANVLGYFIDLSNIWSNGKYYLQKHRSESSFVIKEDEYTLDRNITVFSILADESPTSVDRFYYSLPRGRFSCLISEPNNGNTPSDECADNAVLKITLTDGTDYRYVYIERGGVIYESDS